MYERQFSSAKVYPSKSKRQFYKELFYVHHPLLEQMIQAKLEKCLRHGHLRERHSFPNLIDKNSKVKVIEAPYILGNQKKIEVKISRNRKSTSNLHMRDTSRPKTTYTVIRSRTTQPRIREKLQHLIKDEQFFEQSLKPALNIQRYQQSRA